MKKLSTSIVTIAAMMMISLVSASALASDRCATYAQYMKGEQSVAVKAEKCRNVLYRNDCKQYAKFSKNSVSYMKICKQINYDEADMFASAV